jgi:flagellin
MGLRINQNIAAMNAYRNLSVTDGQMSKSLEKLSSGFRINRAADDAAGLSISEHLRSQTGGLKVAARNAQDAVSVVQTADGALTETQAILQRMRDLAVQANNSGSQDLDSKTAAQTEFSQLQKEIDRIAGTTKFGGSTLLDGTYGLQGAKSTSAGQVTAATVNATIAADQFSVALGAAAPVTVTLNNVGAGTYTADTAGAASLQTDLQKDIDATTLKGSVKANVNFDSLTGKLQVQLQRTSASSATDGMTLANVTNTPLASLGLTAAAANPTGSGGVFQVGANNNSKEQITVSIGAMDTTTLAIASDDLTVNAAAAIDDIDKAITAVSTQRATLGAYQNRFEHTINNLNVAVENLTASESRIRDTDMAQEMTQFTRSQILSQAGTAMLAQANQAPQNVMQLLRG